MTKRYRETVQVTDRGAGPVAFSWRGSTYRIVSVLGHWREDAAYWSGGGIEVPQRDLWRVEARNGSPARPSSSAGGRGTGGGVYELVNEDGAWRLDRVWD